MPNPTSGIIDNYGLRYNWGTAQLEMNTGAEVWVGVPNNITDLGLANGKILVGNSLGVATAVTMSGDATLSNLGVLTVSAANGGAGTFSATTILGPSGGTLALKAGSAVQNGVSIEGASGSSILSADASTGRVGIGTT